MLPRRQGEDDVTCSVRGICSPLVSRLNMPNFAASGGSVRRSMHSILARTRRWRTAVVMSSLS